MFTARANLPFPLLPEDLKNAILLEHSKNSKELSHFSSSDGSSEFKLKKYSLALEEKIKKFVNTCICQDYYNVAIQAISEGDFGPHKDPSKLIQTDQGKKELTRHYTLLYIIQAGGNPLPSTKFYESATNLNSTNLINYKDMYLEEIGNFQFQDNTWNVLSNQIIHAVSGIKTNRICLAVGFYDRVLR